MFVCSFKASTVKIICAAFLCIAASVFVIALMPDAGSAMNVNKIVSSGDISLKGIDSEEKRVSLLSELGIEADKDSVRSGEVSVPKKFDAVLEKYNELQKSQGFDLKKYRGKNVERYTYSVLSFADGTKVGANPTYVTLIIYKNKVIGADICCPETGEYSAVIG